MDIIGGIIPKRTVSRAFAIGLFIALLFLFRKLLILLVFFVVADKARLAAQLLHEPDSHTIVGANVPKGVNGQIQHRH